jgi:hypothetical protein
MLKRKEQVIDATNWIALPDQTKFVNSSGSKLPTEEITMSRLNKRERIEQRRALIESYTNPPFMNLKARLAKLDATANQAALTRLVLAKAAERKAMLEVA